MPLISPGPSALYNQYHPYLAFPAAILAGDFYPDYKVASCCSIKPRQLLVPPPDQDVLGKYPNVDGEATHFGRWVKADF